MMNNYFDEHRVEPQKDLSPFGWNQENTGEKREGKKVRFRTAVSLVIVSSLLSSFVAGGALYLAFTNELNTQNALNQKASISANMAAANTGATYENTGVSVAAEKDLSISEIAKKVGPSIIGIRMTVGNPESIDANQAAAQAEGSGIVISQDGYIMTNYHVVEYADPKNETSTNTTLEVFLPDGRQAEAQFIGGDSSNDLAVIKVDLTDLPVANIGDSSSMEVGDQVVAIGNPLGMDFAGSVTTGIVSALNRQVDTEKATMSLIQTDAAINPGNSGGALVNMQGQVIGINSAKIAETGVEGIGFAIPINDAKPVVDQLKEFGYVQGRPLIGISGQEITETIAQEYNMTPGIYIASVTPGSGAANAGLQKEDILVAMDGKEVKTMLDLNNIKEAHKAGDTVSVSIIRGGEKLELQLTFTEDK